MVRTCGKFQQKKIKPKEKSKQDLQNLNVKTLEKMYWMGLIVEVENQCSRKQVNRNYSN